MNNDTLILLIVMLPLYVIFGLLLLYCFKSMSSPSEQRLEFLRRVTSIASSSIQRRHPSEHPERKKQRIETLTREMLREMKHQMNEPFTIDSLIDESMDVKDTDMRLMAIRLSEAPTEQLRVQSTPPLGMRQKAILRKTGVLSS